MKFKFFRKCNVPFTLRLATRNMILNKCWHLEKEIELIGDQDQKVNEWNVLMDDFRITLNVVEQLKLLPAFQITAFRNIACKLKEKGDAAMNELYFLSSKEFAPY